MPGCRPPLPAGKPGAHQRPSGVAAGPAAAGSAAARGRRAATSHEDLGQQRGFGNQVDGVGHRQRGGGTRGAS
eukprot:9054699-Alexandrium_andersonii.AAC.1